MNGTNAINAGKSYYNYYQYLPMRSKTNITSSEFDSYLASIGYTQQITNADKAILGTEVGWDSNGKLTSVNWHCNYSNKVWYRGSDKNNVCISKNKSKLVGAYEQLKETEDYKGVNAFLKLYGQSTKVLTVVVQLVFSKIIYTEWVLQIVIHLLMLISINR